MKEPIPRKLIYGEIDGSYSIESLYKAAHAMLAVFLKENVTGRSWHYHDSDEQLEQERQWRAQKLWEVEYEKDAELYLASEHCSRSHSKEMVEELSMGGEMFNERLRYIRFLYYAKKIFEKLGLVSCKLWVARIYFLINEILYTPVEQCKAKAVDEFLSFLKEKLELDKLTQSLLYVEFSNILLFYYKYHTSWEYLQIAESLLGVRFELVGKMGVRTKYQTYKTA